MATVQAYKAVSDGYASCWGGGMGFFPPDARARYGAVTDLDYGVGNTVSAPGDDRRGGIYLYTHDGTGLRRAKGTAFSLIVSDGTVPGAPVPGTRGRVLEVTYDDGDVLGGVPADSVIVRVSSCQVVSEVDLDA